MWLYNLGQIMPSGPAYKMEMLTPHGEVVRIKWDMFLKFQQNDWWIIDIWKPPFHWQILFCFSEHFPVATKDINDGITSLPAARLEFPQKQCQCSFKNTWPLIQIFPHPGLSASFSLSYFLIDPVLGHTGTLLPLYWSLGFSFTCRRHTQALYRSRYKVPNSPPVFMSCEKAQHVFWVYSEQVQGKTRKKIVK